MNKRRDQQENEMGIWMKLYKEKKKRTTIHILEGLKCKEIEKEYTNGSSATKRKYISQKIYKKGTV